MSTQSVALTPAQKQYGKLKDLLDTKNVQAQIQRALPNVVSSDRFLRIALTELRTNPRLLECTPESVVGSIIQAAQLGLVLDRVLGQGYLVPYQNKKPGGEKVWECQFQPGYRGYILLSHNSEKLKSLSAQVVREGEKFGYEYGTDPYLRHTPDEAFEKEDVTHVYAIVHYTNGGFDFEVMTTAAVERIRQMSKAPDSPAWKNSWDEMAKKTVIRRLAKRLPVSAENPNIVKAAALDEAADAGVPQNNDKLLEADIPNIETGSGIHRPQEQQADVQVEGVPGVFDDNPDAEPAEELKEKAEPEGPYVEQARFRKLFGIAAAAGIKVKADSHDDELHKILRKNWGIRSVKKIPQVMWDHILEEIGKALAVKQS